MESRLLGVEPCNPAGRRPRPRCPPPAPWPQRIAPPPASWPNGSEDGRDDGEDAAEDTADGGGEDSEDDSGLTSPTATMLTSLLDADPASPLPTAATAVAAWFAHGHARGELKLGLLPFLLEHAMLPGERRCVFLFDDSLRECVAAASASHSCVGGLLFNPDGNHYELTTLLRIEEIKEKSESCTWVQLAAVGRCKISSVRKNKLHGYRLAIVSPFSDEGSAAKPNPSLEAVHAEVASQRRQLAKDLTAADEFDSGTWASQGREAPLGEYKDGGGGGNEYIFVGADSGRACFGVYDSYEAMEEWASASMSNPNPNPSPSPNATPTLTLGLVSSASMSMSGCHGRDPQPWAAATSTHET